MNTELDPVQFIKSHHVGVLSTHSTTEPGYPFGSVTPYIVTNEGDLAIYISELAEHTRNIQHNNKVSLTIYQQPATQNPGAAPRVTCLADAVVAESISVSALRHQYNQQIPDAEMTLSLPGFSFYLLTLKRIRLIGGFGNIKWLEPDLLATQPQSN